VSSREFTEWCAFYKSFPWDYGAAYIVATITNIMRKEGTDAKSAFDFMPADYEPPDPVAGMWDHLRKVSKQQDSEHGKH
jgi:hypothetical protein